MRSLVVGFFHGAVAVTQRAARSDDVPNDLLQLFRIWEATSFGAREHERIVE